MRRSATLVFLGAMLAGVAIGTAPHRSFADEAATEGYQLVAAADGVRVTWTVPNFAVVDSPIDGGGPSAQARLDSLGQSAAFASLPYPGDAFVGLPGLLAGFTGLPALPDYPLYVNSSHPTVPDKRYEAPGATLSAHSDAASSLGRAAGGQGGDAMVSHPASRAETTRAGDGMLTAIATSSVDAVAIGPLNLRGLMSAAKVVRTPDGRQEITSSLAAASASVNGVAAEINERGLVLAGNATPLGGADPITEALTQAGIHVALTKAVQSDSGVVAPTLSITFSRFSDQIQRQVTIRYVLGASSASVLGTAPPALPGTDVVGPGESSVGPSDIPPHAAEPSGSDGRAFVAGPEGLGATPFGSTGPGPSADTGAGANTGEASAGSPTAGRPAAGSAVTAPGAFSAVVSESAGWAWGSLYLVLIAAGLVLARGVELLRSLGVRKP